MPPTLQARIILYVPQTLQEHVTGHVPLPIEALEHVPLHLQ